VQVRKAGVGIGGDGQKLMRDYGVACGGLVDLADMANERVEPGRIQRWSLAGAVQPTWEGWHQRTSDSA
jgi:hypothetical protein